jgi:hypothetical protein
MSVAAVKMKEDLGWTDPQKGLILVRYCTPESAVVLHAHTRTLRYWYSPPSTGDT